MTFPDFKGTKINGDDRVTLSFPWSVMLSLAVLAGITMAVVWDATGDLSDSVDRLTNTLTVIERRVVEGEHERHELDTRISVIEARHRRDDS